MKRLTKSRSTGSVCLTRAFSIRPYPHVTSEEEHFMSEIETHHGSIYNKERIPDALLYERVDYKLKSNLLNYENSNK